MADSLTKTEAKLNKLVKKRAWNKLRSKYMSSEEEIQVLLAKACVNSPTDDSVNLVLALFEDGSDAVKSAALETLSVIASDRVTSTLQLAYSKLPKDKEELRQEIIKTVRTIKSKVVEK